MKRNVSTEGAMKAAPETMFTANKAGKLIDPMRDWAWGSLHHVSTFGKYPARTPKSWNPTHRSRRDDTPPAASAVVA